MAIEHVSVQVVRKPWGLTDLQPWSGIDGSGDAIGELWFDRLDKNAPIPALLLKLLFTGKPLSIQVHPDDAFARTMGLPNGKTEAWYILSATPAAQVAVGLKRHLTPQELRASIRDGSIADLVQWRPVAKGDVIFVPAGTIHAIGAGIVLAEIQQRSDATFRLFDYGRLRDLHEDNAVAAADASPVKTLCNPSHLTGARTVLIASQHFVLERIDLPEDSSWALLAAPETWILVLDGHAAIGLVTASAGQVIFVGGDRTSVEVGTNGLSGLIAYPGPDPIESLLQSLSKRPTNFIPSVDVAVPQMTDTVEAQT
ncbi:class I mannose-6-phosphate isomerase [Bradyrhizobium canariense]|uniref:Mannose-6-phosphate isomerase n=1 Tax=Bradyrhizobium canariense TaxID=255045 RepID=A0A1H1N4I0_9BRAD|nr:class I mannose-6-phosphate isomerase [Bradyrhizobium canariense]SDR93635.1 mannose-6-phosphate isomerase [Bradyrhizobium canariense]